MRRDFSAKVKVAAFSRAAGHCEVCSAHLYAAKFHFDHRIPDALGGEPTLDNCTVACLACHGEKTTTEDVPRIAAAKRQERKHIGIRKPATMPGSRNSRWKKRMDGRVERR
jgi:5-methylcytosine-specific restriction endonuclease McrA